MTTKSVCVLPWVGIGSTNDGHVRACCHMSGAATLLLNAEGRKLRPGPDSLTAIRSAPMLTEIRAQMARGEKPDACKKCWNEEAVGIQSYRQKANALWSDEHADILAAPMEDPPLRYLDLRLSNECNLSCRMCNPYSSRKTIADWPALSNLGEMTGDGQPIGAEELARLAHADWTADPRAFAVVREAAFMAKLIYFSGGEPLLLEQHRRLLRELAADERAKDIRLKYSTNLTVLPADIMELWERFAGVEINVSLDAVGPLNSYIRPPSRWENIDRNLRQLVHLGRRPQIVTTVQIYNAFRIADLLAYAAALDVEVVLNLLHQPRLFSVKSLTPALKERLRHSLAEAVKTNPPFRGPLESIIDFCFADNWEHEFESWRKVTAYYDQHAGTQQALTELVPELAFDC